jgi:NADH-quinone oxidoreductase subunit N
MLPNIPRLTGNSLVDLMAFMPELLLCGAIVLMLFLRLFGRMHVGLLALCFVLLALALSVGQWIGEVDVVGIGRIPFQTPNEASNQALPLFSGLLVFDYFTLFLRCFLYTFTALIIVLTLLTGIPDADDSADFHCLLLGAVVGMSLMASANHLLMVFIGVEMASLPSYALAGFLKGRRASSEAALKYVVYGGGAAGVMLYGISLLAGKFGTGYLPDLAAGFVQAMKLGAATGGLDLVLVLGATFVLVGIGFKLAAVPFHFWCPDVFEGASAEVAGFLSVASKGAALALLARIVLPLAGLDPQVARMSDIDWTTVARYLVPALAVAAALTATFGNLAAYFQTNLKRLLAYSTIAHAGYMMMGLAILTREGAGAVLFYLIAYLFMNLGAFAVVAFLRNQIGSEDLADMRGLVRRSPAMVITLSLFLLSLLGIPPLIGFFGKWLVFLALYDAGQHYSQMGLPELGATSYALLAIGGLNTVISAVYYLKVMKVMIIDARAEDLEGKEPAALPEPVSRVLYAGLVATVVVALCLVFNPLAGYSKTGVERFREQPPAKAAVRVAEGNQ